MRILVTGGAGFIGSTIADTLVAAGHEVRLLDLLLPAAHQRRPDYLGDHELITGDLRDRETVLAALSDVDSVCHQSAMVGLGVDVQDMPEYATHNDFATAVLLAAMDTAGVGRLVFASSMVVYGEGRWTCVEHGDVRPGPRIAADLDSGIFEPRCPSCGHELQSGLVSEDAPMDPRNTYAASKLATEHLAASWVRYTGGSATGMRYHNVYGPRMPRDTPYAGVASIFRSALERGEPPKVFEDGGQRRDFVHVRDVAHANLLALQANRPGFRAYNIASGEPHTIGDMARALSTAFGGPDPVVTGDYRLGDVRHVVASPSLAHAELGFRAGITFADGMRDFATAPLR